jgi:hypothetical protein
VEASDTIGWHLVTVHADFAHPVSLEEELETLLGEGLERSFLYPGRNSTPVVGTLAGFHVKPQR